MLRRKHRHHADHDMVLHVPLPIQIVLFLVVSIVLIVFTRPVAERYFNNSREQTNVGGIYRQRGKSNRYD